MRILHILGSAERGGCEKNCYYFIESMIGYYHRILILNGQGPMIDEWTSLGIKVNVLSVLKSNLFLFLKNLKAGLPPERFDKIIVWTTIRIPVVLNSLNVFSDSKVYVHVGNPIQPSIVTKLKNALLNNLLPVKNQVYLRPVSTFVQQSLQRDHYFRRFSNRVSLKPIKMSEILAKTPLRLDRSSAVTLGMVARLDVIKDHETVIRSFAALSAAYPSAVLELVGDGGLLGNLKKLCSELDVDHRVKFLGEVENVYSVMKEWDVFVYATTLNEGLGGTIPEALSIGLPVVAVDLPMIREWDANGTFITYCSPFNAHDMAAKVLELLRNTERREFIHRHGPDYINKNFSPQTFSTNYIK